MGAALCRSGPRPPRSSFERTSSLTYGRLGALPIYTKGNNLHTTNSCSVDDLCQSPPPTPKVHLQPQRTFPNQLTDRLMICVAPTSCFCVRFCQSRFAEGCGSLQVKEVRKDSLSAVQRWKVPRSWPVKHWPAVLLCLVLLLLLGTALLNLVRPRMGRSSSSVGPVILSGR